MPDESGLGDPARTIELLWGTREPPSRGPKPGLTIAQITEAAIAIADADGLEALSMRRLAGELGVGTMSVYRYVAGKAELIDVMLDTVFAEAVVPAAADWRSTLERFAHEGWAMHRRHPWASRAETRPVLGPNSIDLYEGMLRAMAGTGLAPGDVVNAVELVGHYVAGAARRAAEESEVERRTGISDEEWWAARETFWERHFPPERYPTLSAMWEADAFEARADAFEFGLQRVLDGIEAYLGRLET
jgi:AcrR family transcriptional regulator